MNREPTALASRTASLLAPLDRLRWSLLKAWCPMLKPLVRYRELRVLVAGCGVVGFSLVATLLSPFWLMALGPVILGVPHLVADLRYLVFRPGLHRRRLLWLPVGMPLLAAGLGFWYVSSGLVACACMALLAIGPWRRKGIALAAIAGLLAVVNAIGPAAAILFAHVHNFVAVMLWWCWRPRQDCRRLAVVPVMFLLVSVLLLTGTLGAWRDGLAWQPPDMRDPQYFFFLAPGLPDPWPLRVVLLFAFAQSVHYGVWLRLIPEDDRPQPTPRTFQASARALIADMGFPLLAAALLLALGIALWAVIDLATAREHYLRMALFHGHLELIAATWLYVERPTLPRVPCG